MISYFLFISIIGIIVIKIITQLITNISKKEKIGLFRLFSCSYVAVTLMGCWAWYLKSKKTKDITVYSFFNNTNKSFLTYEFFKFVAIGLVYGFVFGFIDNFGLWFGMDALDPIISGGILTKAGIGNTFSNTLGAILATFSSEIIGDLINSKTGDDIIKTPIWANALGTGAGCIFAILLCRFLTQKK
jgi:hypothetical protein